MEFKRCSKCKKEKPIKAFPMANTAKNERHCWCQNCKSAQAKIYWAKNSKKLIEKARGYKSKWFQENKRRIHNYKKENLKTDFNYFVNYKYNGMRNRITAKKSYHGRPICVRNEFIQFAINNDQLKKLYFAWQQSGYELQKMPTVDRIINSKGYTLDNIQFITYRENVLKH